MSQFTAGTASCRLNSTQLACALAISRAQVWKLLRAGRLPAPVRRGGAAPRWSYYELREWVQAGCPARKQWIARKLLRGRLRMPGDGQAPPAQATGGER